MINSKWRNFSLNLKDISCGIYIILLMAWFQKDYKGEVKLILIEENQNLVHHFLNFTTDFL